MTDLTKDVGDGVVQAVVAKIHELPDEEALELEKKVLEETGPTKDHKREEDHERH